MWRALNYADFRYARDSDICGAGLIVGTSKAVGTSDDAYVFVSTRFRPSAALFRGTFLERRRHVSVRRE